MQGLIKILNFEIIKFNVSATFNVDDVSPFNVGDDLGSNPFKEKGSDESYEGLIVNDHLLVLDGPITRSRAKKIKEAMAGLVQSTWAELVHSPSKTTTLKMGFKEEEPTLIQVIQAKKELA